MKGITKAQAKAYRRRWKIANGAELDELRSTSFPKKFRQLSALMLSAKQLGWTKALEGEEAQVRERWMRLRKVFHG